MFKVEVPDHYNIQVGKVNLGQWVVAQHANIVGLISAADQKSCFWLHDFLRDQSGCRFVFL